MKLSSLVPWWLVLVCTLVSADTADMVAAHGGSFKPTEAPLHQSTSKQTLAPHNETVPTKPNQKGNQNMEETPGKIVESLGYSKVQTNVKPEVPDLKKKETNEPELVNNEKPANVIGFITQNGNIYEIENQDGVGLIAGQQRAADENIIVCNYGSIVIYSDVPCKEVTGVRIGNVIDTKVKGEQNEVVHAQNQNENQNQQHESEQNQQNSELQLQVLEAVRPLRLRNGQKRKRVQQNDLNLRRRYRNGNRNRNRNRKQNPGNRNQIRRRRVQNLRRRKNQEKHHRLQNQRFPTQRRQTNNRNQAQHRRPFRRIRSGNGNSRRRFNERL